MQLEKGQRSILAYFPSSTRAQKAAEQLKEAGLVPDEGSIQVDRISRFGVNHDANYNNPLNNAFSLSGITVFSNDSDLTDGSSTLLAADPSASGIGEAGYGTAGGRAFLLTLVTAEQNVDEAIKIMKANDAQV